MKIFNANLTKKADSYTMMHEPISSIDLMERAAGRAAKKILELYPERNSFIIFVGPGNNGGDGLVIARLFAELNLSVEVYVLNFTKNFSEDFNINSERLKAINDIKFIYFDTADDFPVISSEDIIIDAIFGSGLSRNLSGFPEAVVKKINETKAEVVSIDIPSGLFGEENPDTDRTIIQADHTLTFQYPSLSFLFPENESFTGEFHLINIGIHKDYIEKTESPYYFVTNEDIQIKKRKKFSHKGNFGHAIILAGSYGKAGASVFAVKAACRSGAGLVTAQVPGKNAEVIHNSSPETMLIIDSNERFLSDKIDFTNFNAVGIGPGIGFEHQTVELLSYTFDHFNQPLVLDADALTILSKHKDMLARIPENSILTPHPKEFERLFGKFDNDYRRMKAQIEYSQKYGIIIVLKGAHTAISTPGGKVFFNSTGNPGMATGGSGDVLTGIITSFLAQQYEPVQAAVTAVYMHGLAGDIAASQKGYSGLTASDIIDALPEALRSFEL